LPIVSINLFAQTNSQAFPGAMGWGGETRGAWGHPTIPPVILRVTSLDGGTGIGTFRWALAQNYPRIIVFEVGGVIDMNVWVEIENPYLTVAGQTAPSPGITIIKGTFSVRTHDVIIQHIIIRQGSSGVSGGTGGIQTWGQSNAHCYRVVVDHCSITWGRNNMLSATGHGDGQVGETMEEWRANMSNRITFSNNILAEGLLTDFDNLPQRYGRGGLMHVNTTNLAILRNLYAGIVTRY
jgi:hypothetical protein